MLNFFHRVSAAFFHCRRRRRRRQKPALSTPSSSFWAALRQCLFLVFTLVNLLATQVYAIAPASFKVDPSREISINENTPVGTAIGRVYFDSFGSNSDDDMPPAKFEIDQTDKDSLIASEFFDVINSPTSKDGFIVYKKQAKAAVSDHREENNNKTRDDSAVFLLDELEWHARTHTPLRVCGMLLLFLVRKDDFYKTYMGKYQLFSFSHTRARA